MTSRDFCYWLQGFFELHAASPVAGTPNGQGLHENQVECIRKHLSLVFVHEIDPSAGPPAHQAKLNAVHAPKHPADASNDLHFPDPNIRFRC